MAWPELPAHVGELADESYELTWVDSNFLNTSTTATITIDWYYTSRMPPTFPIGVTPPDLEGTEIVTGIPEEDRTDAWVWDTRNVPAGSYWIWSRVNDLPGEQMSIRIIAFSRGVVTVAHPGDPVHPAIALVQPNSPFVIADQSFDVIYEAFDPDGTGRVKLEAMTQRDGSDAITIAEDLPASRTGTVTWDTSGLARGDWILRATLTDARGLGSTAYARFLLRVDHVQPRPDGGTQPDASRADTGLFYDGGVIGAEPVEGDSCSCSAARARTASPLGLLLVVALSFALRGSGGSCRPAGRSRSCSRRPRG